MLAFHSGPAHAGFRPFIPAFPLADGVAVISAGRSARHAQLRLYYDDGMNQFSAALCRSPISRLPVSSARLMARIKRGMGKPR
jgi:hypothetical protein